MLPLGVLSEKKLGLKYEGNFPMHKEGMDTEEAVEFAADIDHCDVRDRDWMYKYLADNPCYDRDIDYQFWLIGRGKMGSGRRTRATV